RLERLLVPAAGREERSHVERPHAEVAERGRTLEIAQRQVEAVALDVLGAAVEIRKPAADGAWIVGKLLDRVAPYALRGFHREHALERLPREEDPDDEPRGEDDATRRPVREEEH